ncbi:ABC transporter ATP-binding protein [Mesorhizobium sp. M0306]|uniref:ABC transporter ATP-binding protein n=1 Tax=unclassified Mesorhizobium TaxID=325217 RepID=UPI00333877B8
MTDTVIEATNLSKAYRLGVANNSFPTLRDALASGARRILHRKPALGRRNGGDDQFWALRNVSFQVRAGDVLAVIGPNGAGKSTILKILAQIVEPTSGRATIRGRLGALLEVGTGFHAELTGRENIYLNGAILGMRRAEIRSKLDEIVDFSGVEPFLDTPVKRYSSGMYLRLAFAIAAHVDPDILVIDEILAVGDAAFQKKCIAKAESVAGTGRTVLIVSHQMSVLQRLCNRAILIDGGTILADGPTGDLVRNYLQTLEARASTDLSTRTTRTGRGRLRVVGIEVFNKTGPVASGQPAVFRLQVDGPRELAQCVITIIDDLGDPVTSFDTMEHSEHDRQGEVYTVHVESLMLRPGRYRIDVALVADDRVVEDHVETAAVFDVMPGLLDNRPVTAQPGFGSVSFPHRWVTRR